MRSQQFVFISFVVVNYFQLHFPHTLFLFPFPSALPDICRPSPFQLMHTPSICPSRPSLFLRLHAPPHTPPIVPRPSPSAPLIAHLSFRDALIVSPLSSCLPSLHPARVPSTLSPAALPLAALPLAVAPLRYTLSRTHTHRRPFLLPLTLSTSPSLIFNPHARTLLLCRPATLPPSRYTPQPPFSRPLATPRIPIAILLIKGRDSNLNGSGDLLL